MMKTSLKAALYASFAALLPQAAAARVWEPPQGCELFMTVQSQGCRVSNHYRCEGDPEGDQWRADFDQEGIAFRSRINFETEWVESHEIDPPTVQLLSGNRPDPASFSELIGSGSDTFDFYLNRDTGLNTHVQGYDRLTGGKITIDGVELEQTESEATETDSDGMTVRNWRGNEFISREMRLFFSGAGQIDLGDGQWLPIDGTPITFDFPGDKGFGSTRPLYDCDPLTTSAPVKTPLERLWEAKDAR